MSSHDRVSLKHHILCVTQQLWADFNPKLLFIKIHVDVFSAELTQLQRWQKK